MNFINDFWVEVDFLPVGEGERSGDAIAMRWGNADWFWVAVIDGGTVASGEALVAHIRDVYKTNTVNLVVNTHPDQDHASGLSIVLSECDVKQLWLHRPWAYPHQIKHLFANSRFTTQGLSGRIKAGLDCAFTLEEIAAKKKIPIVEPYQGTTFGPLVALAPTQNRYLGLIPHFANTPEAKAAAPMSIAEMVKAVMDKMSTVAEHWGFETLKSNVSTSHQNESSVVLYGRFNGSGVLLTADAGVQSLSEALLYASYHGIPLNACACYQVPHHGSRHNVNPAVLDGLLGPRLHLQAAPTRFAVATVGPKSETHPRKVVTNAFLRRGVAVARTADGHKVFCSPKAPRVGTLYPAQYVPFFDNVED